MWARDWPHFLEIQEALLLGIMKLTESAGVQIALPSQSVFLAAASTRPTAECRDCSKHQAWIQEPRIRKRVTRQQPNPHKKR